MGTFSEDSKRDWSPATGTRITTEQIGVGCLQRIADATEAMSKNYKSLLNEVEWLTKRLREAGEENQRMARRIAALKGHITRTKKS